MKRNFKLTLNVGVAATFCAAMLMACSGNNKKAEADNEDSVEVLELVQAVETPVAGINGTPYNAAFFNDEAKMTATPTDSTYAQTASGLKYVVANEGTGKAPGATDVVTVHYVGTLTDGTQFDSSIDRGEPTSFPLNRVIPGWTEGLQLMKEGGVAVFYIPSNLAYGENGVPGAIPPAAPLIFWVQLISVDSNAK